MQTLYMLGSLGCVTCVCRSQPLCIKSLNNKEVVRVAAGAHHSLALTAQSQVGVFGAVVKPSSLSVFHQSQ